MKKIHLLIIYVASIVIFATGCNRLDVAGMVINRSDTEERVADWLDYNAQNGEPVIENAPDEYHIYSCSDSHYSERDSIVPQGENGVIARAEACGYLPTGIMAAVQMRSKLRGLQDTAKRPLFMSDMQGAARYALDGIPMEFPMNGAWDPEQALLIIGDFSQLVYSIRQDVTYKILTEATIVDPTTKDVIYSLAQQDMVALRAVMRLGWEIPNPVSAFRADMEDYSPFAALIPDNG